MIRQRNKRHFDDIFEEKYTPEPNTGCWLWHGRTDKKDGYGVMTIRNGKEVKVRRAHRLAWERAFGEIPEGMSVLHKCDTPPCVNPEHLFLGTQLDNMRDRKAKGRFIGKRGETNPHAKLTWDDVAAIRGSTELHRVLSARYNVSGSVISNIQTGKVWKCA
jgi:hypothetical protein